MKRAPRKTGAKLDDAALKRGRALWVEGQSGAAIGRALGVSDARVYQLAEKHGWPKRQRAGGKKKLPAAKELGPPKVKAKPRVPGTECPKCHTVSPGDDICSWCGASKAKAAA